ncbi:MAG: hypothetical protein R2862_02410 [Thermoanaerobaculia bacterium]
MRITKMSLGLAVLVVLAFTGCGKIDEMFGGSPGRRRRNGSSSSCAP